jgi:hypothetical protein
MSKSMCRSGSPRSRWWACRTRAFARAGTGSEVRFEPGFEFPPHRITVNLAPADVRKAGASFDLPIALGSSRLRGSSSVARSWTA